MAARGQGVRSRTAAPPALRSERAGGDVLTDPLAGMELSADFLVAQPLGEVAGPLPPSSGGDPLPAPLRGDMERSFRSDFSSVRVHTGDAGGATAFARGEHVHFGPGAFAPNSVAGREVIGHELTHVVQQRAGRVTMPQGMDLPINDDPALEAEAHAQGRRAARGEPARVAGSAAGLAREDGPAQGWSWPWKKKADEAPAPADAVETMKALDPTGVGSSPVRRQKALREKDMRATLDNSLNGPNRRAESEDLASDVAKKGVVGGTGMGFMLAEPLAGNHAHLGGYGGSIGGEVLAGGGLLAGIAGMRSAVKRKDVAERIGDKAGVAMGDSMVNQNAIGMSQSAVSTSKAAVDLSTIHQFGTTAVMGHATTASELAAASGNALSVAGSALGVAGSSLAFMQAVYEGGSALKRWWNASSASDSLKTGDGRRWEARIRNRAKTKAALQGVKVAAAALGIAAGALALASNPVGWAIGIAAGATLGAMALGKLGGALHRKWKQRQAEKKLQAAEAAQKPGEQAEKPPEDEAREQAEQAGAPDPTRAPKDEKGKKTERERTRALAHEAAVLCSENATVASEMTGAIQLARNKRRWVFAEHAKGNSEPALRFHDAAILLKVLGVSLDQAASESGQELVEHKMSAVNGL